MERLKNNIDLTRNEAKEGLARPGDQRTTLNLLRSIFCCYILIITTFNSSQIKQKMNLQHQYHIIDGSSPYSHGEISSYSARLQQMVTY